MVLLDIHMYQLQYYYTVHVPLVSASALLDYAIRICLCVVSFSLRLIISTPYLYKPFAHALPLSVIARGSYRYDHKHFILPVPMAVEAIDLMY